MLEINHSVIRRWHWCALTHVVDTMESEGMRQNILDKFLIIRRYDVRDSGAYKSLVADCEA